MIESNEQGKRAQAKIPLLEQKIFTLESNASLYNRLLQSKDSSLADRSAQVQSLNLALSNYRSIVGNKDQEINIINADLNRAIRGERRWKRRSVFIGFVGMLTTAGAFYIGSR